MGYVSNFRLILHTSLVHQCYIGYASLGYNIAAEYKDAIWILSYSFLPMGTVNMAKSLGTIL